jgi:UDP-N-acetylglucosamine 2-epimerase
MRDAAVLVGNSSSGIIEAASFGTPVVDIGPRQLGRERSGNVTSVQYRQSDIRRAIAESWNNGRPRRFLGRNSYAGGAAKVIPRILASVRIDARLLRKLITY